MFLAVDIGNTTTKTGIFDGSELRCSFRLDSSHVSVSDKYVTLVEQLLKSQTENSRKVDKIAVSSVIPTLTQAYITMLENRFSLKPLILSHKTNLPFKILYDDPSQVGADRIADAAAARKLYGFPSIIIDFGTATTYNVVDNNGDYLGGLISPGLWTSASNLFEKASKLFPVKIEKPGSLIGHNTADSLRSGIYFGAVGQADYIVKKIKKDLNLSDAKVIATGGYAEIIADGTKTIDVIDPDLTLKGLQIIFN